ncbi:MAG: hypothetical protein FWB95_00395 [Treponema sp.]|nr:hypothetical protein [Treponema sp.]
MVLNGKYSVILDDKHRITLPVGLRGKLNASSVIISKGVTRYLRLYASAEWEDKIAGVIKETTDPFSENDLFLTAKYIHTAQDAEIDRAGRILVAEHLLEYANISKECVVLGSIDHIQIWDAKSYHSFSDESNEENARKFAAASEDLSQRIKRKRGIV